ncbi:MFS transporter [Pigmentiphaga litoralis]|uniref:MFS transporter n=1 Tax=Pigmentiphaga litoralis TaxID=516702 RepID=UPI003B430543
MSPRAAATDPSLSGTGPVRGLGPTGSVVLLASILIAFMAASSAPTPLYGLYREAWGFSPITLTVVFGIYAFSLLLSLLTVGALSDYIGRRPVVLASVVLQAVAMVLFILANDVPMLIAARVVQGLATGAAMSALGAALLDVNRTWGALINSVMPIVGMAIGALGSSVLVQFAPAPLHLVYVVLLGVLLIQGVVTFFLRETVRPQPGALASLRPKVRVPAQARRALMMVAPVDVAVWALGGFFLSLGPTLARVVTGEQAPVVGGLLVFTLTICGAASVLAFRNTEARRTMNIGAAALIVGIATVLAGVHTHVSFWFFAGTTIAGVGFGAAFLGAVRTVMPMALPHERAGLMAAFYVLSYFAMSLPAMVAGALVGQVGLIPTTDIYGAAVILLATAALIGSMTLRPVTPHGSTLSSR